MDKYAANFINNVGYLGAPLVLFSGVSVLLCTMLLTCSPPVAYKFGFVVTTSFAPEISHNLTTDFCGDKFKNPNLLLHRAMMLPCSTLC